MDAVLKNVLEGRTENYLLPFFWQHDGHDAEIPAQIQIIYASGCRAFCVESRPYEHFCEDAWWKTMDIILEEARKRDMRVWILDDKHFPTGYANGILAHSDPSLRRRVLREFHVDVMGPAQDVSLLMPHFTPEEKLLAVVMYRRTGQDEELTGESMLLEAKKATGLPIVTELMDIRNLPLFEQVDVIQVGARNTQNFDMLKELGKTDKPILLKRGLAGTIKELLMSAEYIMASGNEKVILCERGIRTYESTYTRNTLDLSVVPVLKGLTHLPVVVDPSHATGHAHLVEPMAMAAAAAGADGIMIEVHNDPPHALCDGAQSLTPEQFAHTAGKIFRIREAMEG